MMTDHTQYGLCGTGCKGRYQCFLDSASTCFYVSCSKWDDIKISLINHTLCTIINPCFRLQAAGGKAEALAAASANFMRQFRDADSRELKQLTAAQFMNIWEHYDDDGEFACSRVGICRSL